MEKFNDYLKFTNEPDILKLFEPDEKLIFSDKLYKYNPFSWKQERNIVITNKSVYNLKNKSLKRKIIFKSISAVTLSTHEESEEFVLHVPAEYDYRYTSPR